MKPVSKNKAEMTPAERAKKKRMKRFHENDRKQIEQTKSQSFSLSQTMFSDTV
jgi:hypothetical protein